MKKYLLPILYFVILFGILASYIAYSTPDNAARMHIAISNTLAKNQQNLAAVWIKDLPAGSGFENCFLDTQWSSRDSIPPRSPASVIVPENGETIAPIPPLDDKTIEALIIPALTELFKYEVQPLIMPDNEQVKETMRMYSIDEFLINNGLRFSLYCGDAPTPVKSAYLSFGNLINFSKVDSVPYGERLAVFDESNVEESPENNEQMIDSSFFTGKPAPRKDSEIKDSESDSFIFIPAAFMFNEPNDVFVRIMDGGKLYSGPLRIEQTYGQTAKFPASVNMHGITRIRISIQSPADFKFTAGSQSYYASLIPNERPFHASIADPTLTPDHHPVLKISPMGTMPTITVDYFLGPAWISRQTIAPEQAANAELTPEYQFSDSPKILYARVSNSTIATDSSQTFAILASKNPIDVPSQARLALNKLRQLTHSPQDAALYDQTAPSLTNANTARQYRDYAFARLGDRYTSSVEVRLRTETKDERDFEYQKDKHKTVANALLVFWFAVGVIAYMIAVGRSIKGRREQWEILKATPGVEAGMEPQSTSGPLILCLTILFIGLMISIYYMMQLI